MTEFAWELGLFDPITGRIMRLTLRNNSESLDIMRQAYEFGDDNHWNAAVSNPLAFTTPEMHNSNLPDIHGNFELNYVLLVPENAIRD